MPQFSFNRIVPFLTGALVILIGAAAVSAQGAATQLDVTLLDYRILSNIKIDGQKFSEASGASYDHDEHLLRIVSDRGRLFTFELTVIGGRFVAINPVSALKLRDADGHPMHRTGFNAEGLETRNAQNGITGDASLIVVSENGPTITEFTTDGQLISVIRVPEALRNPSLQRSLKDGLESFALHPKYGVLTAPEEPLRAHPRQTHSLYSTNGILFSYDVSETGSTNIKSLEVLDDGRVLVLEMLKSRDKQVLIPILRILDPADCDDKGRCTSQWTALTIPDVTDAKFEGVADIGGGLLVIVSDDRINGEHRTVFGLLRLQGGE